MEIDEKVVAIQEPLDSHKNYTILLITRPHVGRSHCVTNTKPENVPTLSVVK